MIHVPPPTAPAAHTFKLTFEIHDLPLPPKWYMCIPLLLVDFFFIQFKFREITVFKFIVHEKAVNEIVPETLRHSFNMQLIKKQLNCTNRKNTRLQEVNLKTKQLKTQEGLGTMNGWMDATWNAEIRKPDYPNPIIQKLYDLNWAVNLRVPSLVF